MKYQCNVCGVTNVKMWRLYNVFMSHQKLFCATCACADQGEEGTVDTDGKLLGEYGRTDQIGWLIPAVPDNLSDLENIETFWGYTSVPQTGCDWWRALPTYPGTPCSTTSSKPATAESSSS